MIPVKPEGVTWTDEQWKAIYEDGKNIIVSAGAGSGKTAVLTERVIRKLRDGVDVNRLLILTFTKAAAGEMADRIRKKIKKIPELREQLDLLDSAYITTFDSFALSIVKKYHYLLNVDSNIGIIDSSVITLEKLRIMDEIFLAYYEEENPKFLKMIRTFCTKDDEDIKGSILRISNQLDLLSDKTLYLNEYMDKYYHEERLKGCVLEYFSLIQEKIDFIFKTVDDISLLDSEFAIKLEESLEIFRGITCYNDIRSHLNVKLPSAPRGSEDELKKLKAKISDTIKEIKTLAIYLDEEEIIDTLKSTSDTVSMMIEIILKFTEKMGQYKREKGAYEFNDIAIMAIDVVKNNDWVRKEVTNYFQEIMIDEYQDTNDLQEEFISLISQHNVYMVGDIKQSIYRFRNANPYIFKNKYDLYQESNVDKKIDLNKNFRSRREVLENINTIFTLIMNDTLGGANYLESHQMIFGNEAYIKEDTLTSHEMEIVRYDYLKEDGFSKDEIEAFIIARDILDKVGSGYLVFDKEDGVLRKATYCDFAIIMDRATTFDLYKKIFGFLGIPLTILKNEKMNDENDILVICNLIKLILKLYKQEIDTEFKYLFISIARSFLYAMSDEEIFSSFISNDYLKSDLVSKCLLLSRRLSYTTPHQLIDDIVSTFSFYEKYITVGDVRGGIVKLSKVREMAVNLEALGYSIEEFSSHLSSLLDKGIEMQYEVNDNGSDSVKLMTIHKSKGLEYPVCYFSGLYKKFNISDLKERFLYDKTYGIIAPYFNEGIGEVIWKDLVRDKYLKEEISEKIRLFYVALTRAREKMIMVLPSCDKEDSLSSATVLSDTIKKNFRTLGDMIDFISFRLSSYEKKASLTDIHLTHDYAYLKKNNYQDSLCQVDKKIEVFFYHHKPSLGKSEVKNFSKRNHEIMSKSQYEVMRLGTMVHEYLEYFSFHSPNYEKILDDRVRKMIKTLMNSPLLSRIDEAKIYQEYEFIFEEGGEKFHGIIDLMLEYDEEILIIDYKLSNILDSAYDLQLKGYYHYVSKNTNKKIRLYLYSLMSGEFREVEV